MDLAHQTYFLILPEHGHILASAVHRQLAMSYSFKYRAWNE